MMKKKPMRIRMYVSLGIALAMIIAALILRNALLGILGALGLAVTLQFTQLDRWRDPEQREMYLPTYKKEWEGKKKPKSPDDSP
jgi:hypothetical protein